MARRDTTTGRLGASKSLKATKAAKQSKTAKTQARKATKAVKALRAPSARHGSAGSALRDAATGRDATAPRLGIVEPTRAAAQKRSVSMPEGLAEQVDMIAGRGRFSAYVTRAVQRQVALDRLAAYVDEVEAELGRPISDEIMAEAEAAWHAG